MRSEEILNQHKGEQVTLGLKRATGVFFAGYVLRQATSTHLFVTSQRGEEAILLSEIVKIEFHPATAGVGGV